MRYVSQLFQPIITIPKNAKIKNTEITCKSQKLLLECGLVRPTSSGLFSLLPLARRALDKLENLVKKHIESVGAQRISLPCLTPESLWKRSGRADQGAELVKVTDRHDKKYVLAPTHEEAISDLLADVGPLSYKNLPLLVYQIGNKYRDELRPKHGLLRAREFRMMDAYAAHESHENAHETYMQVSDAYARLFEELGLDVKRVEAPAGDMGGTLSHEWQLPAPGGEDYLDVCTSCDSTVLSAGGVCARCGGEVNRVSSVEVGHTFILGTKYSEPLQSQFIPSSGPAKDIVMACYGIGTTRLLAASLEALSSDKSMRWPRPIAPYNTIIIGPKEGSKEWSSHGIDKIHQLYHRVEKIVGQDVIVDDRHHLTIGKRLMMADKMGYPNILVCGRSTLEEPPSYELYYTRPQGGHTTVAVKYGQLEDGILNVDDRKEILVENKV